VSPVTEIVLVMTAVAAACAAPGVFLVLRRLAMTADAIGHTLLLGIVLAFAIVRDLNSPWLSIGAAAMGVITVWLVELFQRSRLIKQDAAIGLVFPALFALGTLLASMDFRDIHLDVDAVLLGQVENSRLSRFEFGGVSVPRSLAVMSVIGVVNGLLITVFFKELKLTTFDRDLAFALGFWPAVIQLGLITMVSLTAVAAFDAVGPVLVVAFFVIPAASARLLCTRLVTTVIVSIIIAVVGSIAGTRLAFVLNTNIAGTVTTVLGLVFGFSVIGSRFFR
jgi:manganese/zinc/iron transport system permease protein